MGKIQEKYKENVGEIRGITGGIQGKHRIYKMKYRRYTGEIQGEIQETVV